MQCMSQIKVYLWSEHWKKVYPPDGINPANYEKLSEINKFFKRLGCSKNDFEDEDTT